MKLTILGCGPSAGVPRVGGPGGQGEWGACDPGNPKNRRLRSSILVETPSTHILVDTGPDLRAQMLAAQVQRIDAVVWTHDHGDHSHGIDDLRALASRSGGGLPVYARPETLSSISSRFAYAFAGAGGYPPLVSASPLHDRLRVGDIDIAVVDQPHGAITTAGLVFSHGGRRIGYATDCADLTEAMAALFTDLDVWVVEALGRKRHPIHADLPRVLEWIARLRPRHAILTHMGASLDYAALRAELPPGVVPGFDGLEVVLADDVGSVLP